MRITDRYGGGRSGSGNKDRSDPEAFRRGRTSGQVVRGRLLSPGPGGLFWVVIAGHKLLAALDHEPSPGRELLFRIERLEPELLLKDITPPPSAQSDPSMLLAALTEAKSRFEHHLGRFAPPTPPPLDLTDARTRFAQWLGTDAAAAQAHAVVRDLYRAAGRWISPADGRLLYAPWVFPGLTQSEVLTTRQPGANGALGFLVRCFGCLPRIGRTAILVSWHPGKTSYRLMLERTDTADDLLALLAEVRFGRAMLRPTCSSVGPLPEQFASGFLARILAGAARPFTGLRLRV